jgi:hypothetical protein
MNNLLFSARPDPEIERHFPLEYSDIASATHYAA